MHGSWRATTRRVASARASCSISRWSASRRSSKWSTVHREAAPAPQSCGTPCHRRSASATKRRAWRIAQRFVDPAVLHRVPADRLEEPVPPRPLPPFGSPRPSAGPARRPDRAPRGRSAWRPPRWSPRARTRRTRPSRRGAAARRSDRARYEASSASRRPAWRPQARPPPRPPSTPIDVSSAHEELQQAHRLQARRRRLQRERQAVASPAHRVEGRAASASPRASREPARAEPLEEQLRPSPLRRAPVIDRRHLRGATVGRSPTTTSIGSRSRS